MNAAIDLGNSRLKILRQDGRFAAWSLESLDWDAIETFLAPVKRAIVCSVNPGVEPILWKQIAGARELISARQMLAECSLPFRISAEGIGTDRVLAVLGALRRSKPPLVVIDMGTAMTATILTDRWEIIGGYIAPGVALQRRILQQALPHLALPDELSECSVEPGDNTRAAISAGVCLLAIAFVEAVERHASQCSQTANLSVLVTGGGTAQLGQMLQRTNPALTVAPMLVVEGGLSLLEAR